MQERLQKIISASGLMSRRAAEQLIAAGKVQVNGVPAELGTKADIEQDNIVVNGHPLLSREKKITVMLNKPAGVVTTLRDEKGRPAVSSLVQGVHARIYPIGRLDQYSEGLLLLTNDGELANALMHPAFEIPKTYLLSIHGENLEKAVSSLSRPITIDGRATSPAHVKVLSLSGQEAVCSVTIHEGRNRQIRRLCERAGVKVMKLQRIQEGPLSLGDLQPGQWRYLTEEEIRTLRASVQTGEKP
ncbi:MAG: rRNA pseudouridine synthase [Oscillospiraceae bacterium]|nr:rRNA pseudouridine synthase [Oscillospiraceae bacterium]